MSNTEKKVKPLKKIKTIKGSVRSIVGGVKNINFWGKATRGGDKEREFWVKLARGKHD